MKRLDRWFQSFSVGRRFASDLRPHTLRLAGIGALSLLMAAFEVLRPWPIKWIFDGALMPVGEPAWSFATIVWTCAAAAVAIAVGNAAAQYVRALALGVVNLRVTRELRYRIFSHLSKLSPSFHARHKSGDLLMRLMGDVPIVTTMVVDSAVELATRFLLIGGIVGVMLYKDPLLTGAILIVLPMILLVVRWISRHMTIAVRKQRRKEGALADYLHEAIAATPVIQSLGGSKHVVRRFARSNRTSARAGLRAKRLAARMSASVESLLGVSLAGVLAFGSFRVATGNLTPGELIVFLSYVRSLLKPIRAASKHAEKIAKGTACGERILSILEEDDRVTSKPGALPAPVDPSELTFENVSFTYDGAAPALSGMTATFQKGELAALVGRSGAGKSTMASLAGRLFDPDRGTVRLDGIPVGDLELSSVRDRVGLCMQDTTLLGESIRENLLIARPEATDEEIWRACREAGADGFVRGLPEGLDTGLGAGGVGLSGGQARRLSLARTLLRGASILVVDEPFAGLDREAARQTAATLKELARGHIVIVISHDSAHLDAYDRIVFIDEGRLVAEGTHASLSDRVPLYRSVVRAAPEVVV